MRIHFIKEEDIEIVYFPDTLKFYEINEFTRHIIEDIIQNKTKNEILDKYKIKEEILTKIIHLLNSNKVQNIKLHTKEKENELFKLSLNITNTCNLACKYCYANGGNYKSEECLMNIEDLKLALDVFYNKYEVIKNIQLFGGEPTMNLDAIEYVCKYVENKYKEEKDKNKKPTIGLVTNGTCASERLLNLINEYHIIVTVSIDGPAYINDKIRVFKNQKGTTSLVEKNIRDMRKKTNQPSGIEITYNKIHEEEKIKIVDLIQYAKREFDIDNLHIVPVNGEQFALQNRNVFIESVKDILGKEDKAKLEKTYNLIDDIIKGIRHKKIGKYLCEAGLSVYAVSTKGYIYPCFMLIDQEQFKMGNIHDKNPFENEMFKNMRNEFLKFSKFNYKQCKDCFNNTLCHGCLGLNYFDTGEIYKTSEIECEMHKKMTERIIIELAKKIKINKMNNI
ncbi:hypothetical protein C3495_01405 [Clostridiaceae bacterium 14S0207]|nr:hypothetical protein C3495_01405 [Clostridiaceae bacterium 14S0207]